MSADTESMVSNSSMLEFATLTDYNISDASGGIVTELSSNGTNCMHYDDLIEKWFVFDSHHLTRVVLTWILFAITATGNLFVLFSLRPKAQLSHFIMFHLTMADLIYTCSVLPVDAIWNTTMQWYTGNILCKLGQMWKQFGMYSSSFMVIILEVDRVLTILNSSSYNQQKRTAIILVVAAWISSALCCIPAGAIFSIRIVPTCEGRTIRQCVDNMLISKESLHSYHFFTMIASFILPLFTTIISYSLIVCEITKMKQRDRALMGRRKSINSDSMQRAINKTILMRTLISLTFLLCWGPYYAKGIADWLVVDHSQPEKSETVSNISYMIMYLNSLMHSIVFGVFLQEVRNNFQAICNCCRTRMSWLKYRKSRMSPAFNTSTNVTHCVHSALLSSINGNLTKNCADNAGKYNSEEQTGYIGTQL